MAYKHRFIENAVREAAQHFKVVLIVGPGYRIINIRILKSADWNIYKTIHLEALQSDPTAVSQAPQRTIVGKVLLLKHTPLCYGYLITTPLPHRSIS